MTAASSVLDDELQEAYRRLRQLEDSLAEERQNAETREDFLATVLGGGIFRASPLEGWISANSQMARLWGRERSDLRGDGWQSTIDDQDRRQVLEAYESACRGMTPLSVEFRIRPNAETVRWVLLRMEPVRDRTGFLGTVHDTTQRMLTAERLLQLNADLEAQINERTTLLMRSNQMLEEQIHERRKAIDLLEESQERWRSLVQNAPDTILQLNCDRTIAFINHTQMRPGLVPEAMLGQKLDCFLCPEYVPLMQQDLECVFQHGAVVSNEVEAPLDSGERRWLQNHIAPVVRNGRVTGATVVCRDVTEIKRSAEQLRQTQERLVHVARVTSAGEMAAALAHELNQPLAAITSYIRGCMIRLQSETGVGPLIFEALQDSVDEAHRASEVIRRLRQFLQRHDLQREPASLNELIHDSLCLAEPALRRHKTRVELELAANLPMVDVDRVQIIQVILNLLLNAAEAMAQLAPQERAVRLESLLVRDGAAGLRVTDHGPGLPVGLPDSIFEPFVTTKPGGLGIGLSISRTIVEVHGGTLSCETLTAPGGACFTVQFPTAEARAPL